MNISEINEEIKTIEKKFTSYDELGELSDKINTLLIQAKQKEENKHSTIIQTESPKNDFDRQWQENFDYFNTHKEELAKVYPDQYVAINGSTVIACNPTLQQLGAFVYETYGNIPVYAGFTGEEKPILLELPFEFCE